MEPNNAQELANKIQALLFAEGDAISLKKMAKLLECNEASLLQGLTALHESLKGSGLSLVHTETEAALAVSPETQESIFLASRKEQERDIGDAGLEVLAVLLYEGSSTRADIDYIRGVNSTSTIRTLLSRGLVERAGNPEDGREYLYRPTVELLAHLGVTEARELPDYATIAPELATFKSKSKSEIFHDNEPEPETNI